ncbi:MAG: hypothetical protein ACI9EW_001495 [Cellvibrionaceae bacterium]|jgi:hypothetical protein
MDNLVMGSFNWQDEEGSWDATQDLTQNENQRASRLTWFLGWRRGRVISIVLIGLLALVFSSRWWVGSVEAGLAAEVLESWSIVMASEAAGDLELFMNQLSGSDSLWINAQEQLLIKQSLTARGAILPSLVISQSETTERGEPEVVFSPDLTEATLTHETIYRDRWGRDVALLQDEVFRLGVDRWLFSPPGKQAYWGDVTAEGEVKYSKRFAYSSPHKDAEVVEQIILWFEDRLDLMCLDQFSHACHTIETPQVAIYFLPNWTSKTLRGRFHERGNRLSPHKIVFELPAPSLIGTARTPKDEQLLVEAYGEIYFPDYLLNLAVEGSESPCFRSVADYAAQQVNGVSPVTVNDFIQFLEFQELLGGVDIFSPYAGHAVAFQGDLLAEHETSYKEIADLTARLRLQYRLQELVITPQMLSNVDLTNNAADICTSLLFTDGEKEAFDRFVELRASIHN